MSTIIVPTFGMGLSNEPLTQRALDLLALLRPDSYKLIASNHQDGDHNAREAARRELERVREIIPHAVGYCRLPNSWARETPQEYADLCVWHIDTYYPALLNYQLGCEDNDPASPWWRKAKPAEACRDYYLEALRIIRRRVASDVRIGSAPIQHAPGRTPYVAWYEAWRALLVEVDFAVANCYFEDEGQIADPDFGASWLWYAGRCDKPVVLGEFGVPPRANLTVSERVRLLHLYHEYMLQQERIEAAQQYILEPTEDWRSWNPTEGECRALRAWREGLKLARAA